MIREWLVRSVISGAIAGALYLVSASVVARIFSRGVNRDILRHDVKLGAISLAFGSPVIQGLALLAETYHVGFAYTDITQYGWAWWLLSMPIYVLLWDLVFYATHRVLHWPLVYRKSHFRHHACRPPVAWSGIAIDPLETILSGIMPYTIPLLFLPFHIYTVYALNIALMFWAMWVHSSSTWQGNNLLLAPRDHNLHHTYGLKNLNFAAVFPFWDRLLGTLDRETLPPWWGKDYWSPSGGPATRRLTAPTAGPDAPGREVATAASAEPRPHA